MSERETLEALRELINDYGVGLSGDMRTRALALIEDGLAARQRAAIMAEQASYALRYRSGEDLETLRGACRAIVNIQTQSHEIHP